MILSKASLQVRILTCALAMAVTVASTPAHAQSDAQKKEQAKEHFDKARKLYDVGRYAEAIEEYQKVYLLIDDPTTLYNIAQAYRLWDKPDEAIRFYRNYLRRSPGAVNRAEVEKKISDLEKVIEDRKRGLPTPPPTPPPVVETPAPSPVLRPPTTPPPSAVTPPPVPPPASPPAGVTVTSSTSTEAPPSSFKKIAGYTLLITGGALVATSIIFGSMASQKAKEIETAAKGNKPFDPAVEDAGKAASGVAVVTGVAGAGCLLGGGLFLWLDRPAKKEAAVDRPRTRVALFPLAGPGFAGAGAGLTF